MVAWGKPLRWSFYAISPYSRRLLYASVTFNYFKEYHYLVTSNGLPTMHFGVAGPVRIAIDLHVEM